MKSFDEYEKLVRSAQRRVHRECDQAVTFLEMHGLNDLTPLPAGWGIEYEWIAQNGLQADGEQQITVVDAEVDGVTHSRVALTLTLTTPWIEDKTPEALRAERRRLSVWERERLRHEDTIIAQAARIQEQRALKS